MFVSRRELQDIFRLHCRDLPSFAATFQSSSPLSQSCIGRTSPLSMLWKLVAAVAAIAAGVDAGAMLRFSCSQLVVERLDP